MKQNTTYGLLAAALSSVAAAGTPVLAPRASTTVTPITVTGNGTAAGPVGLRATSDLVLQHFTKEATDSTSAVSIISLVSVSHREP